jgi:hypothetical protein
MEKKEKPGMWTTVTLMGTIGKERMRSKTLLLQVLEF